MILKIASPVETTSIFEQMTQECVQEVGGSDSKQAVECHDRCRCTVAGGFDLSWVQQSLTKMLRLAIDRSPARSEIQLTACHVGNAVEVEVADSGETPTETWIAFQHHFSAGFGPMARELWAHVQSRVLSSGGLHVRRVAWRGR